MPNKRFQRTASLVELAGRDAHECGIVPLGTESTGAVGCAERMLGKKKPFPLAVELQGIDSHVWNGIAADASGQVSHVFFDSDARGSVCYNPRIMIERCSSVTLPRGTSRAIRCSKA